MAIISAGNAAFLISMFVIIHAVGGMVDVSRMARRKIDADGAAVVAGRLLVLRWEYVARLGRVEWLVMAAALLLACLVVYPAPDRATVDTGAGVDRRV